MSLIQNSDGQLQQPSLQVHQQHPPQPVQMKPISPVHQILADQMAQTFLTGRPQEHRLQPLSQQVQKVY